MTTERVSFEDIQLPIPENIYIKPHEIQGEIHQYLLELDEVHKKAYLIAYNHLGSSFNIIKSNGYKEWKNSKKQ